MAASALSLHEAVAQFNGCPPGFCPVQGGGGGVAPWTPASLPNLIGWWDFSNTDSITFNSSTIAAINDLSGTGNTLSQATAVNQPGYNATGLNSKGIATATGGQLLSKTSFALGGNVLSVFCVAKETTHVDNARILGVTNASNSDSGLNGFNLDYRNVAPTLLRVETNSAIPTSLACSTLNWDQLGVVFDGTNATAYVNGVASTPGAATPAFIASPTFLLFANSAIGNGLTGAIAEVIVCKTALGASDRNSIKSYFTAKWGV